MKKIFKMAHKKTKEMKEKYPEIDYQAQFGLFVSYLMENKEEEKEMVKLKGSPKQIAWAEDIRNEILENIRNNDSRQLVKVNKLSSEARKKLVYQAKEKDSENPREAMRVLLREYTDQYIRTIEKASKLIDIKVNLIDLSKEIESIILS